MRIKLIILGLLLFVCGFGTLGWFLNEQHQQQEQITSLKLKYGSQNNDYLKQYNDWLKLPDQERMYSPLELDENGRPRTEAQIREVQQLRLKADMDTLAADESNVDPFYNVLYGQNWWEKVAEYKKQKEINEVILTVSSVCGSLGGIVLGWLTLISIARVIIKIEHSLCNLIANLLKSKKKEEPEEKGYYSPHAPQESDTEEDELSQEDVVVIGNTDADIDSMDMDEEPQPDPNIGNKVEKKKLPCKAQRNTQTQQKANLQEEPQPDPNIGSKVEKKKLPCKAQRNTQPQQKANLQEEPQPGPNIKEKVEKKRLPCKAQRNTQPQQKANPQENVVSGNDNSKHIGHTLLELTEQVSAIREYAATQQNRLQKLQDGYDWNIIKTFCLRIIRCIDNLETRISSRKEHKELEEVRDELIFALESSGVERFEPEINSDFRGQEKFAEVVKTTQHNTKSDCKGKIEKVIRPGYKCFIDDETVRVVRPAQVRVYG